MIPLNIVNSFNKKTPIFYVRIILLASILFLNPLSTHAFAQTSYDMNIPTGAASPDAPYFWQSEKDGSTSGIIEILVGDTVVWKNADTATHTVTAITESEENVALFDSGLFASGKSFSHTFTEIGDYPYYCIVHPWMEGTVIVTAGYSIIPHVGKQVGDGSISFDVEYSFNRVLSTAMINEEKKSITFEIIGNTNSENNELELRLPSELIDGPFVIWVDGEQLSDFELVKDGDLNVLNIELDPETQIFTVIGISIVPEFGSIAIIIFGVSVITMVVLSQRNKLSI